ncbi:MAG: divergent polysaccharide deacetylase family protein, partial [Alphaproteobacteria bacterium]|nr:divergent polysaccharide deacetylase family protein [Alphaproteobacteria bacterium]
HIGQRLAEVEKIARAQGHAVAIGHPHGATIEALANWLPHLEKAGFVLVPVSMIIKHRRGA